MWNFTPASSCSVNSNAWLFWCRFPNGCADGKDLDALMWDSKKLDEMAAQDWVMWHAACIKGMSQKLSSLKGLLATRNLQ